MANLSFLFFLIFNFDLSISLKGFDRKLAFLMPFSYLFNDWFNYYATIKGRKRRYIKRKNVFKNIFQLYLLNVT